MNNLQLLLTKKIWFKLIIITLLIILSFSFIILILKFFIGSSLESKLKDAAKVYIFSLEEKLLDSLNTKDDLMLLSYLDVLKNQPDVTEISISDENGKVIAHTDAEEIGKVIKISSIEDTILETKNYIKFFKTTLQNNRIFLIQLKINKNKTKLKLHEFTLLVCILYLAILISIIISVIFIIKDIKKFSATGNLESDKQDTTKTSNIQNIKKLIMSITKTEVLILNNAGKIIYLNDLAKKRFGENSSGKSLLELHNAESLLKELNETNRIYTIEGEKFIVL